MTLFSQFGTLSHEIYILNLAEVSVLDVGREATEAFRDAYGNVRRAENAGGDKGMRRRRKFCRVWHIRKLVEVQVWVVIPTENALA